MRENAKTREELNLFRKSADSLKDLQRFRSTQSYPCLKYRKVMNSRYFIVLGLEHNARWKRQKGPVAFSCLPSNLLSQDDPSHSFLPRASSARVSSTSYINYYLDELLHRRCVHALKPRTLLEHFENITRPRRDYFCLKHILTSNADNLTYLELFHRCNTSSGIHACIRVNFLETRGKTGATSGLFVSRVTTESGLFR